MCGEFHSRPGSSPFAFQSELWDPTFHAVLSLNTWFGPGAGGAREASEFSRTLKKLRFGEMSVELKRRMLRWGPPATEPLHLQM